MSEQGVTRRSFDEHDDLYIGDLDDGRVVKVELDCHGDPDDIDVFYGGA